jgi:transketolase
MALEPLAAKFSAFGYAVQCVKGNDIDALVHLLEQVPFASGKPNLILAETTKGAGISFMENNVTWHHHVPTPDELERALQELEAAEQALEVALPAVETQRMKEVSA